MSSTEGTYTAGKPLARQDGGKMHAYREDHFWPSSCATTESEGTQWWSADFKGGERTVAQVRIEYAHYENERMQGAVITVGGKTCGVIKDAERPDAKKKHKFPLNIYV